MITIGTIRLAAMLSSDQATSAVRQGRRREPAGDAGLAGQLRVDSAGTPGCRPRHDPTRGRVGSWRRAVSRFASSAPDPRPYC